MRAISPLSCGEELNRVKDLQKPCLMAWSAFARQVPALRERRAVMWVVSLSMCTSTWTFDLQLPLPFGAA